MDRALLPHLPIVVAVARTRSFVRAAAELDLGASAVSHSVRTAEMHLGAPLFARTTRSVALTEAGEVFIEAAQRALDEIDAAAERVAAWQFTFSLPPNHSPQSPAPTPHARQRLEAAHARAVNSTLSHFGNQIVQTTDDPPWEEPPTAIFATYRGTPTERNARQVQTTGLFVNVGFVPDGSARTFQTEAVIRQAQGLEAVYRENLARELAKSASQPQARQPKTQTVELPRIQQSKAQGHQH